MQSLSINTVFSEFRDDYGEMTLFLSLVQLLLLKM